MAKTAKEIVIEKAAADIRKVVLDELSNRSGFDAIIDSLDAETKKEMEESLDHNISLKLAKVVNIGEKE